MKRSNLMRTKMLSRATMLCFYFLLSATGIVGTLCAQEYAPVASYNPLKIKSLENSNTDLQTLILTGKTLMKTRPDSAIAIFQQALHISHPVSGSIEKSDLLYYIAKCYEYKQNYTKAIAFQKEAISATAKDKNTVDKWAYLAQLYNSSGAYVKTILLGNQNYNAQNHSDSFYRATLYTFAGNAYVKTGSLDSAAFLYHRALRTWPELDTQNAFFLCMAYSGLAQIATSLENQTKALEYTEKALNIAKEYKDSFAIINLIASKSAMYYEAKDYEEAERAAQEGLHYAQRINNYDMISLSAYNISGALIKEGKYKEGLKYGILCYNAAQNAPTFWIRLNANYIMGYALVKLKRYPEAIQYLLPAIKKAKQKNYINNIADAYSILSVAYAGIGQYKKAYEYRYLFSNLEDSLKGSKNARQVARIEAQYQTAKQKQKLAEQKLLLQQNHSRIREKNFWIGGITGGTLLLGILFLTLYRSKSHKQKAKLLQFQKQQELDLLKARMDTEQEERNRIGRELHDGIVSQLMSIKLNVNTLQDNHPNVQQPALNHIAQQLEEATLELRTTSHNLMPEALLKAGLEKAVGSLCEQIQRFSKMEVSFQVYGTIPVIQQDKKLSMYRMVQELIQNVIKHAEATQLLVQLSFRDPLLSITVEDNGVGLSEAVMKNDGIGWQNIRQRVAELQGTMDIKSNPGVETAVYLEFEIGCLA